MNLEGINHQTVSVKSPRSKTMILGVALLGLIGIAGWGIWQLQIASVQDQQPEAVSTPKISTVTALGRLEPEGETINLTAPTSTQQSRIAQLLVKEGDRVKAGQVIAILDNRDRLQAALQTAEEQVQIARTKLAQVEAGAQSGEIQAQMAEISRLEAERVGNIDIQQATIARLQAEVQNAQIEDRRYELLYQEGAVSASQRDATHLTYTTAQLQLKEAQSALERIRTTSRDQIARARATLEQIKEVRPVDISAAKAEVQSAVASVMEAKANLTQAYVRSPSTGQIIKIHTRPGEDIASEGVATLGQTQQMMVVAEVYQSDIIKIQPSQIATMTTPVIPDKLKGTVDRIGLQVERQQVINEDPTINIDAKVIEVHIRLDQASSQKVAGLTNLQITATIETP